jgi:CRISPR system Cascade subunit CasA
MISLLAEKWLPVRRSTGEVAWIAPDQIAEPDIVAFAANRADFNGALAQMMIGLLQTCTPVNDEGGWGDLLEVPPSIEVLRRWFAPVADAFILDGEQARFMQDFSLAEGTECTVDALLIDAAGGSAIDKNTDHFVKRNTVRAMCPNCVATALFTLQTNAPAGGAGNRTSLRGGGPLTTLVVASRSRSLWQDLWLNVKPQRAFLPQGGNVRKTEKNFTFPWLADISEIQPAGGEVQPLQVHPHHLFWAMPRRIRLDFISTGTGQCDICKRESTQLVNRYITRPQGLNYKGAWRHPFSPYYEVKGDWLPVHPQPGGFTYKNWLAGVLGSTHSKKQVQAATMVSYVLSEGRQKAGQLRLWMFGYDMDNMKPRCWYETTFPLYNLAGSSNATQRNLQAVIKNLIEASEQAAFYVRQAVKQAWFGDSTLRGDLSFVDKSFWDKTEPHFYVQLKSLIARARSVGVDLDDTRLIVGLGVAWLKLLRREALQLFDLDIVGAGSIAQQNPRRIAEAYNSLQRNFEGKAIKNILRVPVLDKVEKARKPAQVATKKNQGNRGVTNSAPVVGEEIMKDRIVWTAESRFGKVLHHWWEGLDEDHASRAILRRCATLDEVSLSVAYQQFYRYMLSCGWPAEAVAWQNDRLAAIAGLLAHIKTEDTRRLPSSMWDQKAEKPIVSELRFRDLLKIQDIDDLFVSLRRILPLLDCSANIFELAHDVYNWDNPSPSLNIPKQWAYSYRWPVKQSA